MNTHRILTLGLLTALPALGEAQTTVVPVQEAQLSDPLPAISDAFGWSCDLDGERAVIGVPPAAAGGSGPFAPGEAQVWVRSAAGWMLEATLAAPAVNASPWFAYSVAIEGERAIVGGGGSAWVFERSGSTWIRTAELIPQPSVVGTQFGHDVAISGDTVAVASPDDASAYVFRESGGVWSQEAQLGGGTITSWADVELDQDTLAVWGGTLNVFVRSGSTWSRQASLEPDNPSLAGTWGWSFDIEGDLLMVGAFDARAFPHTGPGDGAVYVFERNASLWSQTDVLYSPLLNPGDTACIQGFGSTVALDGNLCAIGAPTLTFGSACGARTHVFALDSGAWTHRAEILSPAASLVGFGLTGMALHTGRLMIGMYYDTAAGVPFSGSAAVYRLTDGIGLAFCAGIECPCSNPGQDGAGCSNSAGPGATLVGTGSNSVMANDLSLSVRGMPPGSLGLAVAAEGSALAPFGDGLRCVAGNLVRFPIRQADLTGGFDEGPGVAGSLGVAPGDLRAFQAWYRDPSGPCGAGFNTSNGYEVVFVL